MNGAPFYGISHSLPLSNSDLRVTLDYTDWLAFVGNTKFALDKDGYPSAWHPERGKVTLHRWVLGFPEGEVDHINRDKLDCRKSNLRPATKSIQSQNRRKRKGPASSQFVGVTRRGERWTALIKKDGVTYRLGRYDDERDAALAYNGAALALYGKDAGVNDV